ncbi:MAG: hypothetical protein Aureis2KO_18800 [Aureisphaera sp.]
MCLGVPVIATDCGGPREIIYGASTSQLDFSLPCRTSQGILIEKPDKWNSCTLTDEIKRLLNNPELYQAISKAGRERANTFSLANSEQRYIELINRLTQKSSQ